MNNNYNGYGTIITIRYNESYVNIFFSKYFIVDLSNLGMQFFFPYKL
jgi:hypothetical protein